MHRALWGLAVGLAPDGVIAPGVAAGRAMVVAASAELGGVVGPPLVAAVQADGNASSVVTRERPPDLVVFQLAAVVAGVAVLTVILAHGQPDRRGPAASRAAAVAPAAPPANPAVTTVDTLLPASAPKLPRVSSTAARAASSPAPRRATTPNVDEPADPLAATLKRLREGIR
jgi:hypothetical protein